MSTDTMSTNQPDSKAYDAWHGDLEVNQGADDPWYQLVRRQLAFERDVAGRRILEIGCGRGGFACWLAGQDPAPAEIVAMDYSPVAVEKGRAFSAAAGIRGLNWQTGDIQAIAYPDGSFDTVVSCETIEHVPDPAKAVSELGRVLRPGGRLFLTAPNYMGAYGLYRAFLRLRGRRFTEVGQPINQFTVLPRTMYWIRRAGLKVTAIRGEGHYTFYPGALPRRHRWLDLDLLKWFALHVVIVATKPHSDS
jgi:2-polyprenyl-3-methyl-5-hydroxy-6-metoxy-1,4-benzoquinol methylase